MSKKILLLGCSGFIGKRVLNLLLSSQSGLITCTTRSADVLRNDLDQSVNVLECDLLAQDFDFLYLIKDYDVVINCIGELRDESKMHATNFDLVKKLADAIIGNDLSIRYIHLSSVGCYGAVENNLGKKVLISENSSEAPVGMYENTKTLADNYLKEQFSNSSYGSYTVIRPTIVFGKNMPNDSIRALGGAVKNHRFFYVGRQTAISNYIHVDDVAESIVLSVKNLDASKNKMFIVSNDCEQKIVINAFAQFFKVKEPFLRLPLWLAVLMAKVVQRLWASSPLTLSRVRYLSSQIHYSNSKIKKELGFYPAKLIKNSICQVYEK